jgi:hypothetical protein
VPVGHDSLRQIASVGRSPPAAQGSNPWRAGGDGRPPPLRLTRMPQFDAGRWPYHVRLSPQRNQIWGFVKSTGNKSLLIFGPWVAPTPRGE